ncbi:MULTISPECIES: DUF1064 domain-containing protein [Pseudomonas]|uniref:DUF1064 domain-containing protein n=1 Tax=Pseudomonas TaxID=286 RepID=UPI000B1B736E|nr:MULTISPECIES: DUF1064 domain-containing protein [Pseudomonas]MDG9809466.1 DUF1064 domain-containing protein [Pseudomonas juntendi]MDG9815823.1 DUF1064 domain-containing protein [Pseudomonas putida]
MTKRWMSEEQLNNLPPGYKVRETGRAGAQARRPAGRSADAPPPIAPAAPAAEPTKSGGLAVMQAKGRLAKGTMNATEARYAAYLDQLRLAGEVLQWKFEAIKLQLAPDTTLTPDFMVMLADGSLEMHDVKGAKAIYTDDAKVKMKVAAREFPFVFRVVFPMKKADGGGWNIEVVGG